MIKNNFNDKKIESLKKQLIDKIDSLKDELISIVDRVLLENNKEQEGKPSKQNEWQEIMNILKRGDNNNKNKKP